MHQLVEFEVIYEFNGIKAWENVFAIDENDAKNIILEKNDQNNVIFLSIEVVNQDTTKNEPDLSTYINPAFRLSDESYSL